MSTRVKNKTANITDPSLEMDQHFNNLSKYSSINNDI